MLEQTLIDLENRAVSVLQGICPRITRRTAQFVPPGVGVTLDVTAKVRSEVGGSAVGQSTVEFWLTAAAKHSNSSLAQDWAQLTVGYGRDKLGMSPNEIPELSQLARVDYLIVADNKTGEEWLHVYRAIQEITLQNRAANAALRGINTHTVTESPSQRMKAVARSATIGLLVDSTLAILGTVIPVVWANARQNDRIELLDASGAVVETHTVAAAGPGTFDFANAVPGQFGARLLRDGVPILTSLTTAQRIAPQGLEE